MLYNNAKKKKKKIESEIQKRECNKWRESEREGEGNK